MICLLKPTAHGNTVAATVDLVTELLSQDVSSPDRARRALERLQMRARASDAAVWSVTNRSAIRLMRVCGAPRDTEPAMDVLADSTILFERLRRHQAVIGHDGEVSGLEALVPEGVRSFVVVASPRGAHRLGVLVIGWDSSYPPCDESAIAHFRVADHAASPRADVPPGRALQHGRRDSRLARRSDCRPGSQRTDRRHQRRVDRVVAGPGARHRATEPGRKLFRGVPSRRRQRFPRSGVDSRRHRGGRSRRLGLAPDGVSVPGRGRPTVVPADGDAISAPRRLDRRDARADCP